MTSLAGKSALVTGGGGGFGKACAVALARDGAAVTLMDNAADKLERARAILLKEAPDAKVATFTGDAMAEADVIAALDATAANGGAIDIVVGTVGGGQGFDWVTEVSLDDFMYTFLMNVGSAFLLVKHGAPRMAPGSSFVFISSVNAVLTFQKLSAYCASKAALDHFVRTAADELGSKGIRLNCVRPGLTHTDGMDAAFARPGFVEGFAGMIPLGRPGVAEDIAPAVRFLAGPESSWITGQSFGADGGNQLRMNPPGA